MKLAAILTGLAHAIGPERGLPERYLYEKPNCDSIALCADNPGCDGKLFTKTSGTISVSNYQNFFGCRWEVKGGSGSKIKVKVESGSSFGIENQPQCGFDKLHIRSGDDKGYGRLCSSRGDSQMPYNGMAAHETFGGIKYKSSQFHDWLLLDTDHLVIAFDSDQQTTGKGFKVKYEIVGNPATGDEATIEEVGDHLEDNLADYIDAITDKAPHKARLSTRLKKLFNKFDTRMKKCKNGDQSGELHYKVSSTIFEVDQIENVKREWLSFFRTAFNNCDIHIIRVYGDFDATNWPKRISSWFTQLSRDLRRK